MRRIYGPLLTSRPWRHTAHLLLDLPLGIAWFTIAVTLLSVGGGLAITIVGLPLLAVSVLAGRWIGSVERARARAFLDDTPAAPAPFRRRGTTMSSMFAAIGDGNGWKGLLYGGLMLPWGIITFTIAVTVWSIALSGAAYPLYAWALPNDGFGDDYVLLGWGRVGYVLLVTVIGWWMLALAPRIMAGLAAIDRSLVRALLAADPEAALTARVSELEVSRDASVESAAGELRRIERDLHDGAQQRLVSLAMNLGIAKDRLDQAAATDDGAVDPRTAELVGRAHDEAKQAIAELRDLVRGIHPAVLTDRGLDAAVSALAARCPVPVELRSELTRRYAAPIEATAYFVVAEALTNVAKHSAARRASVRLGERDGQLIVEIADDGVGGASEEAGGGLRGLADRVRAVEGRLRIASPAGGPTTIIAELPCGS
jgi:signal transduction histidine kinase